MRASELWAIAESQRCEGQEECHWCGGQCTRKWTHDDSPPIPFAKPGMARAKKPNSPWICKGCFLFRRQRQTIRFFDETYEDSKSPIQWGWWIEEGKARALRGKEDRIFLWPKLLAPPPTFCLSILLSSQTNHLHLAIANDYDFIDTGTRLEFTLDNIPHAFSVCELEQGLRQGVEGREAGVRAIINWLGDWELPEMNTMGVKTESQAIKQGPNRRVQKS